MALKKKSKVSAEFSMSSLTDIIFLLLIFFMLTSSVVVPNALNMKIPGGKGNATVQTEPARIQVKGKNTINFLGVNYDFNTKDKEKIARLKAKFEKAVRDHKRRNRKKPDITLKPLTRATTGAVAIVMDVLQTVDVNCILELPE